MHESEKISEARYFHSRMLSSVRDRDGFRFNLSAFLSAARSVLQYALKEAQGKKHGQAWYDSQLNAHPIAGFFRDKRDVNIPAEPVSLQGNVSVQIHDSLHLSASLSFEQSDPQGNVVHEGRSEPEPNPPTASELSSTVETRYVFDDWNGSEDVPTLCARYLDELESIVADGRAKGFLSD
jgi:hypothetical protein